MAMSVDCYLIGQIIVFVITVNVVDFNQIILSKG